MKKFLRTVVWLLILAAILFGVYMILPEYPQSYVKSLIQPHIDAQAKERIDQVKAIENKDVNATYESILEANTNTQCWVYEELTPGVEKVTFYGKGAQISVQNVEGYEDHYYDKSCSVKFEFMINNGNVSISCYINDELQDDVIRKVVVQQLYGVSGK
jgi:hypothetical protein